MGDGECGDRCPRRRVHDHLKESPSGPKVDEAKARVAELEKEAASRVVENHNTPEAYRDYAARHPTNKYAGEATRRATPSDDEALGWTVQIGSKAAYDWGLEEYVAASAKRRED